MSLKRLWYALCALVIATALVVATGCGGDDDSGGGGDATEATTTAASEEGGDDGGDEGEAGGEIEYLGGDEDYPTGQTPPPEDIDASGKLISFLTISDQCLYCAKVNQGVKDAAEITGAELDIKYTNFDPAEQTEQANQAVAQQPDAVIIFPADASAIFPMLQRFKQADIPTVIVNSMPDRDKADMWTAYRGSDDVGYGRNAAQAIVDGMEEMGKGDSGQVAIVLGTPNHPVANLRVGAFEEKLAEIAPNVEIVAQEHGDWDQTAATEAATGIFTRFGDKIDGVFALADNMLAGAITAAERAGVDPASIPMVSINCTVEAIENVTAGKQYASFISDGHSEGVLAATTASQLANGDEVPHFDFLPGPKVTKENISDCEAIN